MPLSGKLWPMHPKPLPDELLSSWLVRLARANSVKVHTLCSSIWPDKSIWNRDIDKSVDGEVLRDLAEKTATSYERVFETTLWAYEGHIYEKHNPNGNTPWIMPVGMYHRFHRRYGLQYCSECLASDQQPYFRRKWRLAFMTVCERHVVLLRDCCPKCRTPVNFHRSQYNGDAITFCARCKFDLRKAPSISGDYFNQLHYQIILLKSVEQGWLFLPGKKPIYSHLYFAVLHQIMKLLSKPAKSAKLRKYIRRGVMSGRSRVTIRKAYRRVSIEEMGITTRLALITLASWLLTDWPYRFVYLCRLSGLLSSELLKDMQSVPYWYWTAIYENLYKPEWHPSDHEIFAAIDYMRRLNIKVGPSTVSKVLGVQQAFRKSKKKLDYYINN